MNTAHTWRKRLAHIIWPLTLCLALTLGACGKKEDPPPQNDTLTTPAPQQEDMAPPAPAAAVAAEDGPASPGELAEDQSVPAQAPSAATLEVTQTTAYFFRDINGFPQLYAALEYQNNGQQDTIVSNVKLHFKAGERTIDAEFIPMLNADDYIRPGEKSTLAYWLNDEGQDITDSTPLSVTAEIEGSARPPGSIDRSLLVRNLSLIQNYPAFSTLTGSIQNPSPENQYALTLIYASFYDADHRLLGVWHFSKNMSVHSNGTRNFSLHIDTLPIPDLAKNTAQVIGRGIGID